MVLKDILELTKKSSQSRESPVNLKPSDIYEDDNIRYKSPTYAGCLQPRPNASTLKPQRHPDFYDDDNESYSASQYASCLPPGDPSVTMKPPRRLELYSEQDSFSFSHYETNDNTDNRRKHTWDCKLLVENFIKIS